MSPTEFDLRAALREGEGEGLSANRLIADGRARRTRRRMQLLSAAAVVFVVSGAGVGIALIGGDGNGGSAGSDAQSAALDGRAAGQAPSPAQPTPDASSTNAAQAELRAIACPDSLPRYLLPGGGSPGQFGSDGPLFSRPVRSLIVCGYGTPRQATGQVPTSQPARLELSGTQATRLATSLENAATANSAATCPTAGKLDSHELAIIGVAADGAPVGTVTATLPDPACNVQVTNGTAIRYDWTPPSDLQRILVTLVPRLDPPASLPNHTPSGKVHGSPISS
jgi:hypothetical protein